MASALANAHIEAERRLRTLTANGVKQIWRGLPGYDKANVDQWLSEVLPLVEAAQRHSVALTDAYLARAMERQPVGLDLSKLTGAGVRNGTPPAEVYERPFVTLWGGLGEGLLFQDAADKAMARAVNTATTDVQLSMRATLMAVAQT